MAAASFAGLLAADGITVQGHPAPQAAPARAEGLASVSSPPLSAIAGQMLEESNNVIAENLARQVALKNGQPASYSGAAAAVAGAALAAADHGRHRHRPGAGPPRRAAFRARCGAPGAEVQ